MCVYRCTHIHGHTWTLPAPLISLFEKEATHKHSCTWKADALICVLTLRGSVLHDLGPHGGLNHFHNWGPQCHHQQCSSATQADAGPTARPGSYRETRSPAPRATGRPAASMEVLAVETPGSDTNQSGMGQRIKCAAWLRGCLVSSQPQEPPSAQRSCPHEAQPPV